MDLPSDNSIQTQITDGVNLVSQVNDNTQILQSVVSSVPQIQTVLTDNIMNVSSLINAPFIEVTSVNGMTGDVVTEPIMENFQANHYYPKNTMINYNGQIYWAKNRFTSGSSFNINDWNAVSISISSAWNDITGKPNFATVATSGSYTDLSNTPSIPTVNNAILTIQKNGANVQTFTANASSNVTANITVPTKTSDLTNDSGFIKTVDNALSTTSVNPVQNKIVTKAINDANTLIDNKISVGGVQGTDLSTNAKLAILNMIYPVGSIFMSASLSTPSQVASTIGGTWAAWGAGRVPVGMGNNGITNYTTVEATGGAENHYHSFTFGYSEYYGTIPAFSLRAYKRISGGYDTATQDGSASFARNSGTSAGTSTSANNAYSTTGETSKGSSMQPYITCYMYKRTA